MSSTAFQCIACFRFQDVSGLFQSRLPWKLWLNGLMLHSSVSTSWFSSSSVRISGSAESRLAPRSLTKQGWLISLRMVISFINSFMVFSLLSQSSSRSTFSCFAAIKLPFQLEMDTVLLQVVQSSFFTMTSLGSTSKDRSLRWLEIDAKLICSEKSLESRPIWVLTALKTLHPRENRSSYTKPLARMRVPQGHLLIDSHQLLCADLVASHLWGAQLWQFRCTRHPWCTGYLTKAIRLGSALKWKVTDTHTHCKFNVYS